MMVFALIALCAAALPDAWAGPGFDYGALRSLIRDQQITGIDDLVSKLPEVYLENYALMYASREDPSQAATSLKPRAFLYGDGQSGLVISFSGDVNKAGSDVIEISQFDQATNKVDYKLIRFQAGQVIFEDGIDHPQPASCLRCHMDSRPIWEETLSAPGSYGGRKAGLVGSERENFAKFVHENTREGRYSYLKGLDEKGEAYLARKPSERMAALMMEQNQKRLAQLIRSLPEYAKYRFEIAAALSGVDVENRVGGNYANLLNDTKKLLTTWHDANVRMTERLTGASTHEIEYPMPDLHDEERIARVRLIIEEKMGLSMKNWSTTFKVDSFTEIGLDQVYENLQKLDPELKPGLADYLKATSLLKVCDQLLTKP